MDEKNLQIVSNLIGNSYVNIAQNSRNGFSKKIKILFEHKKIPKVGFSDNEIEIFLREISNMDANNYDKFCGVGEREGRVYSNLVKNRHFNFSHGIGRSGNINSIQPKAAGSSIINKLTNHLVLHLLQESGMKLMKKALLLPMATGMSLVLIMLLLRSERPLAKYVIWSRIDQKSCFKCIKTAGFEPIVIETIAIGDELQTNTISIHEAIESHGPENILCILTTTSCFAPRVPDNIMKVGKISQEYNVPHVINNAYGISLKRCMNVINEACVKYGKQGVYAVVQSTDKNLMVPIGGAIVASCDEQVIDKLSGIYAGRASISPSLDVFITLLSMGLDGYKNLMEIRETNFKYLREQLIKTSEKFGLRVLDTPHNPVSLAMTLKPSVENKSVTRIGSELFYRNISGARIVECSVTQPMKTVVEGHEFIGFGSHSAVSSLDYMNAASAIGQTKSEIDRFIENLNSSLNKFYFGNCGNENAGP